MITTRIEGTLRSDASLVGGRLVLFLLPWQRGEVAVSDLPIRVELELEASALQTMLAQLTKGAIAEVTCQVLDEPGDGGRWWAARGTHAALRQPASQEEPIVIDDAVLGQFTLDRRRGQFSATHRVGHQRFELAISRSGEPGPDIDRRDLERARDAVARIKARLADIRAEVGAKMLPLFNDNWRGERKELSQEAFVAKVKLTSCTVHPDGTALLYFSDGKLFDGHWFEVFLDAVATVGAVRLAG